jgi:hypothetical protein
VAGRPNDRQLNYWELGAALVVFALGVFMTVEGLGYSVGSVRRMGPGFFPVAVGVIMILLSIGIMLEVRHSLTPAPDFPLRPLAAITAGLIAFGVLIEPLGLVPATFILVFVSAFGDASMNLLRAIITAAAIAALGYVVFVLGFRLPLDPFWW